MMNAESTATYLSLQYTQDRKIQWLWKEGIPNWTRTHAQLRQTEYQQVHWHIQQWYRDNGCPENVWEFNHLHV